MTFFLGTHQPQWLGRVDVPLFVSHRRLQGRVSLPKATGPWALDSGGFSELSMFGQWTVTAQEYAAAARRYAEQIGNLAWAAPQDWMCEPWIVAKTGLSVRLHQLLTIRSLKNLRRLAPEIPWAPVLQGWTIDDYHWHVLAYRLWGIDLAKEPVVGLGSVCRRQHTREVETLINELQPLRIHGFGLKLQGLAKVAHLLASADSMAWSAAARREPPLPGCQGHQNCANCMTYALKWRQRVLDEAVNISREPALQLALWGPSDWRVAA